MRLCFVLILGLLMLYLTFLNHAQVEHQSGGQAWSHYLDTDGTLLIIGICLWFAFLLISATVIKKEKQRSHFYSLFALFNIVGALVLDEKNLLSALIFLNLGFILLFYNLFKDKVGLVKIFKKRSKDG